MFPIFPGHGLLKDEMNMLYSCFTKESAHQEDSKGGDQLSRIVRSHPIGDEIDDASTDWVVVDLMTEHGLLGNS
jgi:hypothetical protein